MLKRLLSLFRSQKSLGVSLVTNHESYMTEHFELKRGQILRLNITARTNYLCLNYTGTNFGQFLREHPKCLEETMKQSGL